MLWMLEWAGRGASEPSLRAGIAPLRLLVRAASRAVLELRAVFGNPFEGIDGAALTKTATRRAFGPGSAGAARRDVSAMRRVQGSGLALRSRRQACPRRLTRDFVASVAEEATS